jgi:hypothetical protein
MRNTREILSFYRYDSGAGMNVINSLTSGGESL